MICLVTDRRRLGRAVGVSPDSWVDCLVTQVSAAVGAGVDLVQLRETDLEAAALLRLTSRILSDVPHARGRLVVNERLDVALAAGAAGVHLRERSLSVAEARRLAPVGFRIGRSVHHVDAVRAASDADYLIAGTILSTTSKSVSQLLGWDGLTAIVRSAGRCPVLGIGGLTRESVPALAASGASGLAAIGAFIPGPGQALATFVHETVMDLRFGFDSTYGLP